MLATHLPCPFCPPRRTGGTEGDEEELERRTVGWDDVRRLLWRFSEQGGCGCMYVGQTGVVCSLMAGLQDWQ